jgi:alkylhydroperoxidase family enzyme
VVSRVAGCQYCQAHTLLGAHNKGVADDKLAAVWNYATSPLYSARERAALDFAVAASQQPNAVTDEVWAELRAHWSETEVVEILAVVAMFAFLNRWNDTMQTPLEAPAIAVAEKAIGAQGWSAGHHR